MQKAGKKDTKLATVTLVAGKFSTLKALKDKAANAVAAAIKEALKKAEWAQMYYN